MLKHRHSIPFMAVMKRMITFDDNDNSGVDLIVGISNDDPKVNDFIFVSDDNGTCLLYCC